mmetsp:Transcript_7588/g.8665  ORF Transcript_7588/g.8665 Transcript_7588/m.8665 type:complete len:83 (+) Transcript_7588:803-1051(+)
MKINRFLQHKRWLTTMNMQMKHFVVVSFCDQQWEKTNGFSTYYIHIYTHVIIENEYSKGSCSKSVPSFHGRHISPPTFPSCS